MKEIEWWGLYSESWQGEIVPEAFSHPAKFSRAMIRQVYQHMIDMGYIKAGDRIVDPFGGVGLGAFDAMKHGLHWEGCELEPRFVELGNQNLGLWQSRYAGWFANWGTAVLRQGDSRYLSQVIGEVDAVVSSSPYGDAVQAGDGPGAAGNERQRQRQKNGAAGEFAYKNNGEYGRTPGQLGNMRMDAAVSSAPFESSGNMGNREKLNELQAAVVRDGNGHKGDFGSSIGADYGSTPGNIGNDSGATFWTAARDIVQQVHEVLKPGGYGAFVCGDFVRKGERVYFGKQWLDLCTAVGFEPVEWITCWKTEYRGTQLDIFGGENHKQVDRVSFFRRLANEKNPDAAILNEDVIIVRKRA